MCCGIDGPTDWYSDGPDRTLPKSCCHALIEGEEPPTEAVCRLSRPTAPIVYQNGCYEKLQMKLKSSSNTLVGVGIGIAFIEVILLAYNNSNPSENRVVFVLIYEIFLDNWDNFGVLVSICN